MPRPRYRCDSVSGASGHGRMPPPQPLGTNADKGDKGERVAGVAEGDRAR